MGIEEFYNIMVNDYIQLKDPSNWDDPYENMFSKFFSNNNEFLELKNRYNKCLHILQKEHPAKIYPSTNIFLAHQYRLSKHIKLICLTKENSKNGLDQMWRSYSYNNQSVRVGIDFEDWGSFTGLKGPGGECVKIKDIKYKKINLKNVCQEILNQYDISKSNIEEPFFYKRKIFQYENETRLSISKSYRHEDNCFLRNPSFLSQDYDSLNNFIIDVREGFQINTLNILETISTQYKLSGHGHKVVNVLINPLAPKSIDYFVKSLCADKEIIKHKNVQVSNSSIYTYFT